ncbi:hypothetical protein PHYBLDRAFT_64458 [Phycomyces blakesleeanus NRRL 1555(-)]|uniref:Uncharacterized protein n=1 Tax=Phycomyces blakesleeanus (strain ATCC 8743b / DSM 1359 / FGSC 10004 / NBRC 33097 / NRRL 1555) TaxID=763407 RepID=A0A162XL43_PHYB8|nr:hypothetical protein PHYBLDRAFT_64458 [Phycomyces blakesleeanus NRRL 1555(-)]OAD75545.1 hypothetical protein PHYBLDRAFT_64458 [Phycomyces blakesleeanus NRRL 1555(-)]|eukprot:XP_018293585.1 hypothetical protein PHYBLDRAFT_64458 [Phycomyces blakesleeanus NRRL 1555(-)]
MNNTDNTVIQLLQGIQAALISLKSGQEALLGHQETLTEIIPRPISKINDITLKHIYKMITYDLRIELTEETKKIVNTCTKIICNQLAALSSVQDLGTNPGWSLLPQEDKNRLCINYSIILRDNRIVFTRCHRNWASIARVSQL